MSRSALGLGKLDLEDTVRCQVIRAAPESGGGDASAKQWDWNSKYWCSLGSPWGGAHGLAPDVAQFLAEFLYAGNKILKPDTTRLILCNHIRRNMIPRGLGFEIGREAGSPACSAKTFGHSGATGTLAWADPMSDTVCVILTTLPSGAVTPHPRQVVSDHIANAIG